METDLEPKDHADPLIEAKQKKLVKWKRRCGRIVGHTGISTQFNETSVLPVIRPERKLAPLLVYRAQRTPFAGWVEHL
jgi:hypothetical protein